MCVCVCVCVCILYTQEKDAYYGFDYLHLVQEWPGSFCDTKKGYAQHNRQMQYA